MPAPVLISVYTRLNHLQRCVESLLTNALAKDTELYIVSDAPFVPQHREGVERVRDYVRHIDGFKAVHLMARAENMGSTKSILSARMELYQRYDTQIFMEDDNIVSPYFLEYLNDALERYRDDPKVFGICGFNVNVPIPASYTDEAFFMTLISANGWGGWKAKYERFFYGYTLPDFRSGSFKAYQKYLEKPANNLKRMARQGVTWGDAKITHYLYEQEMVCLLPCQSLVYNTGWDGTGEHCGKDESYLQLKINTDHPIRRFPSRTAIDPEWLRTIQQYSKYPFLGKYKTALYDLKVRLKKSMRR